MSVAKEKLAYSAHDWSEKSFVMKLKGLVYSFSTYLPLVEFVWCRASALDWLS